MFGLKGGSRRRALVLGLGGALVAAAATGLGFADTFVTATGTFTVSGDFATVQAAGTQGKYGGQWSGTTTIHNRVPGNFATGDLVVITNGAQYNGDLAVTITLTNAGTLATEFSYLALAIGVWCLPNSGSNPQWALCGAYSNSSTPADQYLTLPFGSATFIVPASSYYGASKVSVSVDGGTFYPIQTGSATVSTFVKVAPATGNA
jgi:hypothetical protein